MHIHQPQCRPQGGCGIKEPSGALRIERRDDNNRHHDRQSPQERAQHGILHGNKSRHCIREEKHHPACLVAKIVLEKMAPNGFFRFDSKANQPAHRQVQTGWPDKASCDTRFIEEWGICATWLKAAVFRRTRITLRDMRCARRCHARSVGTRCRIMYPYHKWGSLSIHRRAEGAYVKCHGLPNRFQGRFFGARMP